MSNRVLLVHERFPPDYAGGGEYVVLETAKALMRRNVDVHVVTTGDSSMTSFDGVPTKRLPVSPYRLNLCWREIAAEGADCDLIQAFTYHSLFPAYRAAAALGKPLVFEVLAQFDEAWLQMKGPILGRVFRFLERRLLALPCNARIFLSPYSLALAKRIGAVSENDEIIEPGISLQDYRADPEKHGVLFAGKLDIRKGIDDVLAVAAALPEIRFRLVGWGSGFDRIARDLPPNAALVRFRDRSALADELARARIFLFPTQVETFGLAVAEAMASGCAIVSTSELPFAGRRVEFGDTDAMVRAVNSLWHDDRGCREFGVENQQLALRYSWDRHVEALLGLYRRVAPEFGQN